MDVQFEWDQGKAGANLLKHGVDFEDAVQIFQGAVLATRSDRAGEERYKAIGLLNGLEIAVVYTTRGNRLRIISARRAGANERAAYHSAHLVG